jgi:hypothetical protein
VTDVLGLTKFRQETAALLYDSLPPDIGVFDAIPDSIMPPSVYVTWSNPWLLPSTFCVYASAIQLILVSQRIEPGGSYEILESLLGDVLDVMHTNRIFVRDVTSPYPISLGGVDYLGASVNIVQEMGD